MVEVSSTVSTGEPAHIAVSRPWRRFSGELGLWPVIIALALIAVGFDLANGLFLSPRNLSNLVLQTATAGVLTVGVVLVLLVGDIDLSIGSVSGFTAAIMALLVTTARWPAAPAILAALLLGAVIGTAQGAWIVFFRAPSFIVTLTGLLVWQGAQLAALQGHSGQILLQDPFLIGLSSNYLPSAVSWALAGVVVAVTAASIVVRRRSPTRSTYGAGPLAPELRRLAFVVVLSLGIVGLLNTYLGVPYLLVILLGITLVFAVIAGSTVFGRHMYAVGGSAEAARRSGIQVGKLRVVIFACASTLAAIAGVLEAGRSYSVSVSSGGGNTSLNAIAAAVIGGTSLFGGRGRLIGALLGALVISSVQNGLALLGRSAAEQTIVTGLVLLAAVTIDVTSRRRRLSSGAAGS